MQYSNTHLFEFTATKCLCCGRALSDAESVELGLGPVCSKRFYKLDHEVTPLMIERAMGILAVLEMSGKVPEEVVTTCIKLKADARRFSNALVYWLASQADKRETILAVTPVVAALGFSKLADKLNESRTEILLLETNKGWWLQSKRAVATWHIIGSKRRVRGPQGFGNRVGYLIPLGKFDELMCVLGMSRSGHFIVIKKQDGTRRHETIVYKTRADLDALQNPAPVVPVSPVAPVATGVRIVRFADFFEVYTPYNGGFVADLKRQVDKAASWKERKWDASRRCWKVRNAHKDLVEDLIVKHYNQAPAVL